MRLRIQECPSALASGQPFGTAGGGLRHTAAPYSLTSEEDAMPDESFTEFVLDQLQSLDG